ncbi:hypothetical protein POTOM_058530 [Populus tomentosa]|uniref:Uncharacterized protein n=1 Tax=Populus tomentosa TaxID=118781 RepID=A0A8X8C2I5_POPTO|nr:hypothetical protein POTOM_058530 [Populus tomentosa]
MSDHNLVEDLLSNEDNLVLKKYLGLREVCPVARKMIVYLDEWFCSHIEDGHYELNKPVFFTEFGLSNPNKDFQPSQQGRFYKTILDIKYKSEKRKQAGAGADLAVIGQNPGIYSKKSMFEGIVFECVLICGVGLLQQGNHVTGLVPYSSQSHTSYEISGLSFDTSKGGFLQHKNDIEAVQLIREMSDKGFVADGETGNLIY